MPANKFIDIYRRFENRTNILVTNFEDKISLLNDYGDTFESIHYDARSFMLIRLQTLWGHFCRELIINSAFGGYYTISGTLLKKGSSTTDWSSVQRVLQKRGRNHPSWHIADFSIDIARALGIQNYSQVSTSLGGISPMDNIVAIRNFVVHPDEVSRTNYENTLRSLDLTIKTRPVELLRSKVTGGANLFELWVADLQTIAENSMQ